MVRMGNQGGRVTSRFSLIIAGGGTGGHLFPGIAVAREVRRRFDRAEILFVTGRHPLASEIMSPMAGEFSTASIDVEGMKGRGWKKGMMVMMKLPTSVLQSMSVIRRFSPSFVLGVGGYSAGPLCVAARLLKIPTAIHEQNSFPGLTNRLLSRLVDRIFISFEESRPHFGKKMAVLTGNPVRREFFLGLVEQPREEHEFRVLVVGGSQGARAINEAFVEALNILKNRGKRIVVHHQTGRLDHTRVAREYRRRGLHGEVTAFITNMASAYESAHLVVARAGATTIFELAAAGRPSILIPYPHATNNHQEINARSMVRAGGAEMILQKDLNGEALARTLTKHMENRPALARMGRNAGKISRPDAAKIIVDQMLEMAVGK
ncbi:MAG TPA: undecaprenyldiphospho-muramoylpentapeptide beta-N-acetylglucosaminyltransferase [Deltaproteobacteria bacterium]|nr:undecaprenyldiphospho-muramoylpentapeptide beta-N-acetylglucosaminyltransferase [Deltaproteobacteria bacterium]